MHVRVPARSLVGARAFASAFVVASLAACGGPAAPIPTPVAVSPPGTGLAGATQFAFTSASIADDFAWDFGDGSTGVGASVSHVFRTKGTFEVTVTATNRGGSAVSKTTVQIRDVAGTWFGRRYLPTASGATVERTFSLDLVQQGADVTGTYLDVFGPRATVVGTVTHPRGLGLSITHVNPLSALPLAGAADERVDRFTGTHGLSMSRQ